MIDVPTLTGFDSEVKREELKRYFQFCFKRYESLFRLVTDEEAYLTKADPLRHPIIFYYGHTATFFINKLKLAKIIDTRIDPHLESIFAVGVDEMSWDDLNEKHYDWPTLKETQAYRDKVYRLVSDLIDTLPLDLPIDWDSPWWVLLMGIEHENIHLETSSVLLRQLPLKWIREDAAWKECEIYGNFHENTLIEVESGSVLLGKNRDATLFGWDNEYGTHEAAIPTFKASKYLVSNGEFLTFVEEGGYQESDYWCEEGLAWLEFSKARSPLFWQQKDAAYTLRTLSREIVLPLNWPVEVNALEAEAFCRWKSKKEGKNIVLPTEDEYIRLRDFSKVSNYLHWMEKGGTEGNIALDKYASPSPVDQYRQGDFYDVIGNVWQWSRTAIYPFEGFKVHPIYDDFTVPTFDGKHNIINGGSWVSCGNLATQKSRYGFRKHFYQHAGFRYVQSDYEETIMSNPYTTDSIISQYCHFSWGENRLGVKNYPSECARLALVYMQNKPRGKAFDIGCAIGRSSFELAKAFDEVIGVDFSTRFIQEAQKMKENGALRYIIPTEGELEAFYEVKLRDFDLEDEAEKVSFWQADACNLKPIYKGFDLIFAGNLIDRLYDPKKFLDTMVDRLNDKGLLILTSPYTWQEESTAKEKWIGGYKHDGENVTTLQGLEEILGRDFILIDTQDVPFVIQETARKHQHTISQMSVWEKK